MSSFKIKQQYGSVVREDEPCVGEDIIPSVSSTYKSGWSHFPTFRSISFLVDFCSASNCQYVYIFQKYCFNRPHFILCGHDCVIDLKG